MNRKMASTITYEQILDLFKETDDIIKLDNPKDFKAKAF